MFKVHSKDIGVVPVFLLLTVNIFSPCCSVFIVNFEQVNPDWVNFKRIWAKILWAIDKIMLKLDFPRFTWL